MMDAEAVRSAPLKEFLSMSSYRLPKQIFYGELINGGAKSGGGGGLKKTLLRLWETQPEAIRYSSRHPTRHRGMAHYSIANRTSSNKELEQALTIFKMTH